MDYLFIQAAEIENLISKLEDYKRKNIPPRMFSYFITEKVIMELEDFYNSEILPDLERFDLLFDEYKEEMRFRFRGGGRKKQKIISKLNDYSFDLELLREVKKIVVDELKKYDSKHFDDRIPRSKQDFRIASEMAIKTIEINQITILDEYNKIKKQLRLLELLKK